VTSLAGNRRGVANSSPPACEPRRRTAGAVVCYLLFEAAMNALRPLSTGEIIRGAFDVYRRQFLVLFVTAAALGLPGTVVGFSPEPGMPDAFDVLMAIVGAVLALLSSVALTMQVATALLGGQPTLGDGVTMGARRLLPVLGALVWTSIVVMGVVALPLGAVLGGIGWLLRPEASGIDPIEFFLVVSLLVLVFATILGFVAIRYFAVLPIATLESARGVLQRSAALARGAYWKISVVWLVGGLVYGLPLMVIGAGTGVVGAFAAFGGVPEWLPAVATVVAWLVAALTLPVTAALNTLLYLDQRVRKDGPDVQLATLPVTPASPAPMPRPAGS
jgi:hypothetical protein